MGVAARFIGIGTITIFLIFSPLQGGQFHVGPQGIASGPGSAISPWSLSYGLVQKPSIHPGDTVWIHGGTYRLASSVTSTLNGSSLSPIIVRQFPGERAIVDLGNGSAFNVQGNYTWYWGFEVMSSSTDRWADSSQSPHRGAGWSIGSGYAARGIKLINIVTHDVANGIFAGVGALDCELYGCIFYNNGYEYTDRKHGHNIYLQNSSTVKYAKDNIGLLSYDYGFQCYTSGATAVDSIWFEGNTAFCQGLDSLGDAKPNIYFSGFDVTGPKHPVLINNYLWHNSGGVNFFVAEGTPATNLVMRGNVARGLTYASGAAAINSTIDTLTGNIFAGDVTGITKGNYPSNTYYGIGSQPSSGKNIYVRANAYEPQRGHVTVYNWDQSNSVSVDVSNILAVGAPYTIRDVQNYFGTPAINAVYDGNPVSLPMTLTGVSPRIQAPGRWQPPHTPKTFAAFVVEGVWPSGALLVTPDTLPAGGGTVTLQWTSSNATSATINRGIGSVPLNGSLQISVTSSATFTLTLTNPVGTITTSHDVIFRPLAPPVLLLPANAATNQPDSLSFTWNPSSGATQYQLQLATDTAFHVLVINDSGLATTSHGVVGLVSGGKYYWRVRGTNGVVSGSYTSPWSFSTTAGTNTGFPISLLGSPPEQDIISLIVRKNSGMDSAFVTMWVFDADQSSEGKLYVNGKDSLALFGSLASTLRHSVVTTLTLRMPATAWKDSANALRFVHQSTTGFRIDSIALTFGKKTVTGANEIPIFAGRGYSLSQNYPNPFNPITTIQYGLDKGSQVALTVFNLLGQQVAELVNGYQEAGAHEVKVDGSNLSSGVYFYRLIAHETSGGGKDIVLTRTFTLVR